MHGDWFVDEHYNVLILLYYSIQSRIKLMMSISDITIILNRCACCVLKVYKYTSII